MSEPLDRRAADDAPPSTAKDRAAGVDAATATLIDKPGQGDADALVERTVTINRPRAELYAFWRDFANLALFMDNVERIDVLDAQRSHWVVKAPGGKTAEWDAVVTAEEEGAFIAWVSEAGADVPNSGRIDFRDAQGDRGTIVTATIRYDPPAGVVLAAPRAQRPLIPHERDIHDRSLVTLIRQHRDLIDSAVEEAYGWPADLSNAENSHANCHVEQATGNRRGEGIIHWLTPRARTLACRSLVLRPGSLMRIAGNRRARPMLCDHVPKTKKQTYASAGRC